MNMVGVYETFADEKSSSIYVPPKSNNYVYDCFWAKDLPEGALVAQQIQAQSYVSNGFVKQEGLVATHDSEGNEVYVLAPDIAEPSDDSFSLTNGSRIEYVIGLEKGSIDIDLSTGKLVTWKKRYAPLDMLPTYNFCKDGLWHGWEESLRQIDASSDFKLVEPEALGKTVNAGPGVISEFMRNEIQRSLGKGEIWFMGLVEKTVFQKFRRDYGSLVTRQIGEPKRLKHEHVYSDVTLVPTVMDIDNFFVNMKKNILACGNDMTKRQLEAFAYMSDGVSDTCLGPDPELPAFRAWAQEAVERVS